MARLPRRPLITLTLAQGLGLSGGPFVVMVGGVLGRELAPAPSLATLPVAVGVVGIALASAPAALLMQRIGRPRGFAFGSSLAAAGALVGAVAAASGSFVLLSFGCLLVGADLAFVMQHRFAAAEAAGEEGGERAVGLVLAGGVVAGFLGPEVARAGRELAPTPWVGSFLLLAVVYAVAAAVVLVGLDRQPTPARLGGARRRPTKLRRLLRRADFLSAVVPSVVAYGVMTLVMTATPLAMHASGFSVDATARVIQAHVVVMYAPSLIAGRLGARMGLGRLMSAGVVAMAACGVLGAAADALGAWIATLVLLGLGWNYLFLGGTLALARAFPGEERYRAQALNDALVFGARAAASLGAGVLLARGGWKTVLAVGVAMLSLMAAVPVARRLRRADGPSDGAERLLRATSRARG